MDTSKLNQHLNGILDFDAAGEPVWLKPTQLLTSQRLDLVAKYLYARDRELGVADIWARGIYRQHLKVLNEFKERDGSGKSSFDDFILSFETLLDSIKENGFDGNLSVIPIGRNSQFIDGSHRVAACLLYGCDLKVIPFQYTTPVYDAQKFLSMGLSIANVEHLIREYSRLKKTVRVAVLFPVAVGYQRSALSILNKSSTVVYQKDLQLSDKGKINLIRTLYQGEDWLDSSNKRDENSGLYYHVSKRFDRDKPIKFIIFEPDNLDHVVSTKEKIRDLYEIGNDSIHINDHHFQTTDLLDVILDKNGVHWLNNARLKQTENFKTLFEKYHQLLNRADVDSESYCLDGSAPLALYGLRDVGDLDYLVIGDDSLSDQSELISNHDDELRFHRVTKEELIFSPDNHVKYRGVKFASLSVLREMKKKRGEAKDHNDVLMIDGLDLDAGFEIEKYKSMINTKFKYYRYRLRNILASRLPKPLKTILKFIYLLPSNFRDRLDPNNCHIDYLDYSVVYSYGTSIIERVKFQGVYEPEVTAAIRRQLRNSIEPVVLDVGANIGLISLNVLDSFSDAKVYAFEPGEHQFSYLVRNIERNKLGSRVSAFNIGLSDKAGKETFYAHKSKDSSGDGFLDTNRAGKAQPAQVEVKTLDGWWEENGRLSVDLIKIDTEGSELMILRGGSEMISAVKPSILMEIHPENLRVYPYTAADLLSFMGALGYELKTLTGKCLSHANLDVLLFSHNDYMAEYIG
jgi:FkbM family methyltransferase